jgi:ADP-ribosyl-[dinitrogen reductase] hydrolase
MSHRLTSQTNPLRIDEVGVPGVPGVIGMTLCPGKKDPYATFGVWDRDLTLDLQAIRDWGASAIVTLLEEHEFELLALPDFEAQVSSLFNWVWLPIPDGGTPGESFEARWQVAGPELHGRLAGGERIVVHCRAGLGRTGLVVSRLLVESGMVPDEAIRTVRDVRRGTVETLQQEQYVLQLPRAVSATAGDASKGTP